jgi:SRSO17 transposase
LNDWHAQRAEKTLHRTVVHERATPTRFSPKVRRRWAPVYLRGLILPGERKSIEPIVDRVAPDEKEQVHHFVATSTWDTAPIEVVQADRCNELVGGIDAHLIIDDTALPKKGVHATMERSVGRLDELNRILSADASTVDWSPGGESFDSVTLLRASTSRQRS